MKLTAILIVICCLHVSANSYSQNVNFSGKNVPLESVFSSIEKQTGLSFFFNYALIKNSKPVTLNIQDMPMESALREVLKNQDLDFYLQGKTVFIVKRQINPLGSKPNTSEESVIKQIDVHGRVTNQQGESLVGATVAVKNDKRITLTNEKGIFELKNVLENAVLEISFTGYRQKEIELAGQSVITVEMELSDNHLDEAQVIAYGTTTQRLSVGNVSIVKADAIAKQPVNNPLLALEGRVPGLLVTQQTGLPGTGLKIQIRGQNSINSGLDPFYVIDGVPYTAQLLPNLGNMLGTSSSVGGNYTGNPFSFLNPNDIESISILKDADATAIYGSRATNGAILISTKKGKPGQTKVDFNLQNGWGKVPHMIKLMNSQQYLAMRHEAFANDNSTPSAFDYDLNGTWDTTRYTDWQKTLIGGTSQYTNLGTTVSGGSTNIRYLLGGTYRRETTVFPGDFDNKVGSLQFSLTGSSDNQKLKLQLTGNYSVNNNRLPQVDLTSVAVRLAPVAPKLYNSDGTLNWAPTSSGSSSWTNPLRNLNLPYQNKTNNLISNLVLGYQILPGLEIKSSFGYTNMQQNETKLTPTISRAPETRPTYRRSSQFTNNNINSWIIEPQLVYKQMISKGNLELLLGTTIQQNNSSGLQLLGTGYNSDAVLGDLRSATTVTVSSSVINVYKYNALFGRVNYNWQEKYIIDLSIRRDGSSRFGPASQFHNFMAAGAGWIFSEESFIKQHLPLLSYGKLRGSYGTTGNDQIGDYQFLNLYQPISVQVPYQGITSLGPVGLTNPYLQWEETKKAELGINLGFFSNRVLLNASYFWNRSSNQLLGYTLPVITGFTGITKNFPATFQNSGWEITLSTVNIKSEKFNWTTSVNLTVPVDNMKLLAFPGLSTSSYANSYQIGRSILVNPVVHFLGVDPATGIYQFSDINGKPTTTPDPIADRTILVNTNPKYYGGVENSISYKGFELDFLFQFMKTMGANNFLGYVIPGAAVNQPIDLVNRWQKPGDIASHQKYNEDLTLYGSYSNAVASDASICDASFIRLKNLSLSWKLPKIWTTKFRCSNARLYVQGQNLLTLTHYDGFDPETQSALALPPLRIMTFGMQVGF